MISVNIFQWKNKIAPKCGVDFCMAIQAILKKVFAKKYVVFFKSSEIVT